MCEDWVISTSKGEQIMSEKFIVRKAEKNDIAEIQTLIKGLATYEKRP